MTVITDANIHELVQQYIDGSDDFPDDLVGIPIGDWDVSNVTNMKDLFLDYNFNEPIGNWNVSRVTNMSGMFSGCTFFNKPIGSWDVSNVTDMSSMFEDATAFDQPIGGWDVSKVTNMSSMFSGCTSFNKPIGGWDVSNVTDMSRMFEDATAFNQPIGDWDVSRVISRRKFYNMFTGAESFSQPLTRWNVRPVIMVVMFETVAEFNNYAARVVPAPVPQPVPVPAPVPAPVPQPVPVPAPVPLVPDALQNNINYKPYLLPAPHFSVSKEKVFRDSEYFDFIDGVDKRVLDALDEDPTAIVFNVNKQFYVISASDLTNLMNDPDFIKYECLQVDSMANIERSVPYFSMNSMGIPSQGAVPFFHLWTAVHSGNRTYELVKTARQLPSTASHNVLYNRGNRMSAAHCQAGQDAHVYELRTLPVDREHSRRSAAIKIQKVVRGYRTRARTNRRKMRQTVNRSKFDAEFSSTKTRSKTRSNARSKTQSNRRSKQHSV